MAVCSFALAGMFAGLVALSYAELGARYPEAAGAATYVREAFRSDRGSQVTGAAVAAGVLISTATIARGTAGYAQAFVALPDTLGPRGGHVREYWMDSGAVDVGIGNIGGRPLDTGPLH